jgi:hypothetical protein
LDDAPTVVFWVMLVSCALDPYRHLRAAEFLETLALFVVLLSFGSVVYFESLQARLDVESVSELSLTTVRTSRTWWRTPAS